MEDNPSYALTAGLKRELLKRHQYAHHTLSQEVTSVKVDPDLIAHDWTIYDGMLTMWGDDNSARITRMPSIIREIPKRTWEIPAEFMIGSSMVVDIAQDLVVFLEAFEDIL